MKTAKLTTKTLVETIEGDKRVQRLFKAKESGIYAVDTKELMQELEDLMRSRKFRDIKTDDFLIDVQKSATAWVQETLAYRSRAVAIKMSIFRKSRQLQEQLKNIKGHILNTYATEIAQKHTSITAKKGFVDNLLEPLNTIAFRFQSVMDLADMFIEDLDQSIIGHKSTSYVIGAQYGKQ